MVFVEADLRLDVEGSSVNVHSVGSLLEFEFDDFKGLAAMPHSVRSRVRWRGAGAWLVAHGLTVRFFLGDQNILEGGIPSDECGFRIGGFNWRFWPLRWIGLLWRER